MGYADAVTTAAENRATPWVTLPREAWATLARDSEMSLDAGTLDRLRSLQDPTNERDVAEVYLPLVEMINLHRRHHKGMYRDLNDYLDISATSTPFVIAVAGSVAVGKSTAARLLRELISRAPDHPRVELLPTDGFLLPNAELEARGLMTRKGFPETYDREGLLNFLIRVKSGVDRVETPVYSHVRSDVVPGERQVMEKPDVLIIEGLNVLQQAPLGTDSLAISDFLDYSVYVDANVEHIRSWFISRFAALRESAFRDPDSAFRSVAEMPDEQAMAIAEGFWSNTNEPNLRLNIKPSRERATAILHKGADHVISEIRIRKI